MHLETDVLVIGAGGAGIYAALEAHRAGASVILADRSLIGRGGATVMAQMTVAAALGERAPDHWEFHLSDTLAAGRGLCDETLAAMVCEEGPFRIRQMDEWKVGWARDGEHIAQVHAPGHDRPRCVYVDVLSTGPAVSRTLRTQLKRNPDIRTIGDLMIVDITVANGRACGAVAVHASSGETVTLAAGAVVISTGGLTRLYRRNSASFNMGGDGYALAMRAGAKLIDMEFVQFFPIGHLAPRLVGMDPIMWDPFRYKLGGKLLNADMREFEADYRSTDTRSDGHYVLTRDLATYAITREVAAGRGSPAGGAYLSFQHVEPELIRKTFGPIVEKLEANGIDLARQPVEVAPIAHYHMGGVRVNARLETDVEGLFACGEAIGGSNGANRLSGNAITEAFVFGARAGVNAAAVALAAGRSWDEVAARPVSAMLGVADKRPGANLTAMISDLQALMADKVGPFRTEQKLTEAISELEAMTEALGETPRAMGAAFDTVLLDWLDLRNMLLVARSVAQAALLRTESRGAHQRDDYPGLDEAWTGNQSIAMDDGALEIGWTSRVAGDISA
ncbi:MAG: FAD-binding protein [Hyphomicrobiales bacterium]|nr:FAD-binding protein [Hyphomicrobiales bacterium]